MADVGVMADYTRISAEDEKVLFSGKGDVGEVNIDAGMNVLASGEGSGLFSLNYIEPVIKAIGKAIDSMICEFSKDKPLRIEFKFTQHGRIHVYLAPRVEN